MNISKLSIVLLHFALANASHSGGKRPKDLSYSIERVPVGGEKLPLFKKLLKMESEDLQRIMRNGGLLEFFKRRYSRDKVWEFLEERGPEFLGACDISAILEVDELALFFFTSQSGEEYHFRTFLDKMTGWENVTFAHLQAASRYALTVGKIFNIEQIPWNKLRLEVIEEACEAGLVQTPLKVERVVNNYFRHGNDDFFASLDSSHSILWMFFAPKNRLALDGPYGEYLERIRGGLSIAEEFFLNLLTKELHKQVEVDLTFDPIHGMNFIDILMEISVNSRHILINQMISHKRISDPLLQFAMMDVKVLYLLFEDYATHSRNSTKRMSFFKSFLDLDDDGFFKLISTMKDFTDSNIFSFLIDTFSTYPWKEKFYKSFTKFGTKMNLILSELAERDSIVDCSKRSTGLQYLFEHYQNLLDHGIISSNTYDNFLHSLIDWMYSQKDPEKVQVILKLLKGMPNRIFKRNSNHVNGLNRVIEKFRYSEPLFENIFAPFEGPFAIGLNNEDDRPFIRMEIRDIIIDTVTLGFSTTTIKRNVIVNSDESLEDLALESLLSGLTPDNDLSKRVIDQFRERIAMEADDKFMDKFKLSTPSWNVLRLAVQISRNNGDLKAVFDNDTRARYLISTDANYVLGLLRLLKGQHNMISLIENLLFDNYLPAYVFAEALYHLCEMYHTNYTETIGTVPSSSAILQHFYDPDIVSEVLRIESDFRNVGVNEDLVKIVFWYFKGLLLAGLEPQKIGYLFSYGECLKALRILAKPLQEDIKVLPPLLRFTLKNLAGGVYEYIAPTITPASDINDQQEFRLVCRGEIVEGEYIPEDMMNELSYIGEDELLITKGSIIKKFETLTNMIGDMGIFEKYGAAALSEIGPIPIDFTRNVVSTLLQYFEDSNKFEEQLNNLAIVDLMELLHIIEYLEIKFPQ